MTNRITKNVIDGLAATVRGSITQNATWRGDIYLGGDVTIESGATVTVAAGTRFFNFTNDVERTGVDTNKVEFIVKGTFRLNGTAASPVIFKSFQASPSDSDWFGIRVVQNGRLFAYHARFERAYSALRWENNSAGKDTVQNCTFDRNFMHGVFCKKDSVAIRNNTFQNSAVGYGIRVENSSPAVNQNRLNGIAYPIYLTKSKATVTGNHVSGSGTDGITVNLNYNKLQYNPIYLSYDTVSGTFSNALALQGGYDFGAQVRVSDCIIANGHAAGAGILYNGDTVFVSGTRDTAFNAYGVVMNSPGLALNGGNCIHTTSQQSGLKYVDNNTTGTLNAQSVFWNSTDTTAIRSKLEGPITINPITTSCGYVGEFKIAGGQTEGQKPLEFAFFPNVPNPFNPSTRLRFALPEPAEVELAIFNILGQKVKTIVRGLLPSGLHETVWNGADDFNRPIASGVYFARLRAGDKQQIRRMVVVK